MSNFWHYISKIINFWTEASWVSRHFLALGICGSILSANFRDTLYTLFFLSKWFENQIYEAMLTLPYFI